eukprot:760945-Hanusia_phi.AAC.1
MAYPGTPQSLSLQAPQSLLRASNRTWQGAGCCAQTLVLDREVQFAEDCCSDRSGCEHGEWDTRLQVIGKCDVARELG